MCETILNALVCVLKMANSEQVPMPFVVTMCKLSYVLTALVTKYLFPCKHFDILCIILLTDHFRRG
jgi:hypothetical protein